MILLITITINDIIIIIVMMIIDMEIIVSV